MLIILTNIILLSVLMLNQTESKNNKVTNRQETNKEYSGIVGPVDKNKHVKRNLPKI